MLLCPPLLSSRQIAHHRPPVYFVKRKENADAVQVGYICKGFALASFLTLSSRGRAVYQVLSADSNDGGICCGTVWAVQSAGDGGGFGHLLLDADKENTKRTCALAKVSKVGL